MNTVSRPREAYLSREGSSPLETSFSREPKGPRFTARRKAVSFRSLCFLPLLSVALRFDARALDSSSAHFRNARSAVDGGGGIETSASFASVDALGQISLASHTSTSFQLRSGLIPIYFYPGQVAGLYASSGPTAGTVYLQWTAPGNDGRAAGTHASAYLVRVSSDPNASPALSDAAFYAASAVAPAPPGPAIQGGTQTLIAANLIAGTSYYFAFKAAEADGLAGPLSGGATAYAAIAAPGVYTLTFTGVSTGSFTLYWTSGTPVAGYNPAGTQYLAQVSATPAFAGAIYSTQTAGLSAPLSGLDPNTTYYARSAAVGNAASSPFAGLGSTSTLADAVSGAQIVCRVSAASVTATWQPLPPSPSSATSEGFTFEVSTAPDFSGTVLASATADPAATRLTVGGLSPAATYYFRVGSLNWGGVENDVAPSGGGGVASPTGLSGRTGFKVAVLSWDALPLQGACSVVGYNLYRSTASPPLFTLLAATVATTVTDAAVLAGSSYYYQLTGRLAGGGETPPAQTALVYVRSAPPLPPFGVLVTSSTPTSVSLRWLPVTAHDNGVRFASYQAPARDELLQYVVWRSTAMTQAAWTPVAAVSSVTRSWSDPASGPQYYYRVQAANVTDASGYSMVLAQNGSGGLVAPDGRSVLNLSPALLATLAGDGTDPYSAYLLAVSSHAEDLTGSVFKSLELDALQGGTQPRPNLQLAEQTPLRLHYDQTGGAVAASGVTASAASALAAAPAQPVPPNQLSVFWNNGSRWVQLYGALDAQNQALNVQVRSLGRYQLRAVDKPSSLNVDPSGVSNKFITPNGDGKNDNAMIVFANPSCSQVTGKILDLRGSTVATMLPGPINPSPGCAGSMMWDGKAGGRAVPGGVYIYQIQGDNKVFTGTLVVVK